MHSLLLLCASVIAQLSLARIKEPVGDGFGVIWLYSPVTYIPLDLLKFAIRYMLSGKARLNRLHNKIVFTVNKDYDKDEIEAQWAASQSTLHALQPPQTKNIFDEQISYSELCEIAEQAKRGAEVARRERAKHIYITSEISG